MKMTVHELIQALQKIEDKSRPVKLSVNDVITGDFHVGDNRALNVYLSNAMEDDYKPQNTF